MLIRNHEVIRNQKGLLLLMLMDILITYTDEEHKITKEKLRSKVNEIYGFRPSRNTLYEKLSTLESAGFPIEMSRGDGVYYNGNDLTNGELRFLVDSVLYSGFASHTGANEIIEALGKHGTMNFRDYLRKQKYTVKKTQKNLRQSVFLVLEEVQSAIFKKKQIRFNYFTYNEKLSAERVYAKPITVNPYELVYKNGKYYLLGALDGDDKMLSWRIDHIFDDIEILSEHCHEIPLLKEINASGGMSAYIDAQPDLCGGKVEMFKIECARSAIDEIIDAFGKSFSVAPEQAQNPDFETVILKVYATPESMKTWALAHATSMVVLSPESFRAELKETLDQARRLYTMTGKPLRIRMMTAKNLAEAVKLTKMSARKSLLYRNPKFGGLMTRITGQEPVDTSLLTKISDLTGISLGGCDTGDQIFTQHFPLLKSLYMINSTFDIRNLENLPNLEELGISFVDDSVIPYILKMKHLRRLRLCICYITDISFLSQLKELREVDIIFCNYITDPSPLTSIRNLKKLWWLESYKYEAKVDYSCFQKMTQLHFLELGSKHLTESDVQELQKCLPDCRIRFSSPPNER